jgi:hypothetical protein
MRLLPGSRPELTSTSRGGRRLALAPLAAALAFTLLGFAAVGLAGAGPVTAANPTATAKHTAAPTAKSTAKSTAKPTAPPEPTPWSAPTMSPFVSGRHVYDYGRLLSANSVKLAETLAAQIEAAGGGRIVLYTTAQPQDMPAENDLAAAWHVDGLLLTGQGDYGTITVGNTLKAKLGSQAAEMLSTTPPGEPTVEIWMLSTLARAAGVVGGTHVFDAVGALNASGEQQAEAAAKSLAGKLGAPVYVDIAGGGTTPATAASFNASMVRADLGKCMVIALAVSNGQVAGYIDSDGSLWESYHTGTPWTNDSLAAEAAANGDVQAALLAAINGVHSGAAPSAGSGSGGIDTGLIFWVIFAIVMVLIGVGSPFYGGWLIGKLTGTSAVKGGLPGEAVIESISDTGVTVTGGGYGPEAPEYKFGLEVTPAAGGSPYKVEAKAMVPRLYIPMVVPGAKVGVLIDPKNPMRVSIDFSQLGGSSAADDTAGSGTGADAGAGTFGPGGMNFQFDVDGNPLAGETSALVGAVRSGTLPTINTGPAERLLATGTHGTAVITSAQPMGKTVRDLNPKADPSRLNDPMWVFTVEVTVAGEKPFPAVFGHRVPVAKVASIAPGVKLAVAVDMSDRHNEVAIDWDKSPISG